MASAISLDNLVLVIASFLSLALKSGCETLYANNWFGSSCRQALRVGQTDCQREDDDEKARRIK